MDDRRAVTAWCLYDWANSAFACTMMAALYPPFFRAIAEADGRLRLLGRDSVTINSLTDT